MSAIETASFAVQNGVAWLNIHYPGWIDKINLDAFSIDDINCCVLGQLEPRKFFNAIMRDHQLTTQDIVSLGFDVLCNKIFERDNYIALEDAWRDYIKGNKSF